MTTRYDPGESAGNRTSRQITPSFLPAPSDPEPAPQASADHFTSTEDESIAFANTLDQRAYLIRRRLLAVFVTLVFLGCVALLTKAVKIHLASVRAANMSRATQSQTAPAAVGTPQTPVAVGTPQTPASTSTQPTPALAVAPAVTQASSDPHSATNPVAPSAQAKPSNAPATNTASNRQAMPSNASKRSHAVRSKNSTLRTPDETKNGVPVDEIYVNKRGDLVDEKGKPLQDAPSSSPAEVPSSTTSTYGL